jgi:hypothetical protein
MYAMIGVLIVGMYIWVCISELSDHTGFLGHGGRSTVLCTTVKYKIPRLRISISWQVSHFCMWNFVSADKANRAIDLSAETRFHIQKYDGSENIEIRSHALEVTLGSSIDTNSGHNHTKN